MRMAIETAYAVGIDLGGTKIMAALIDQEGTIRSQSQCDTLSQEGEQAVIERMISLVDAILLESGVGIAEVRGVGIATAGIIDTKRNMVVYANNLGWSDVPIGDVLQSRFGLPVKLINDGNAAAVAEWKWGAVRGADDLIYVTVSTGVGAGIISGGNLITGRGDSAGEFGHISLDPDGPLCACGNRGCLENYVSGLALAREAQQRLLAGLATGSLLEAHDIDRITAKEIGEAAQSGDAFSEELLRHAGRYLGVGLTNLIHLFNPEVLVFGGGVMKSGQPLLQAAEEVIRERCISRMAAQVRFELSVMGPEAGVLGGAAMFFQQETSKVYA